MAHPGHPLIPSAASAVAEAREIINTAAYTVKSTTISASATLSIFTHGTHVLVDATGGARTASLPDPTADATHVGVRFHVVKKDASGNAVTVDTVGSPTIDGAASVSLAAQYNKVTVWNDGTNWYTE